MFARNDYISHESRLSNFYNYLNIWMTWYVAFDHFGGVVVSVLTSIVVDHGFEIRLTLCYTPGIRILRTGSNTKNRVRQVTTTFSGEYAIFILSDRQRY